MNIPKIENLQVSRLSRNILHFHQIKASAPFTRCDGLIKLPQKGQNDNAILIDLNLEPEFVEKIYDYFGPISNYICSHTHMDHASHIHLWEKKGAQILAPIPEHTHLLDGDKFLAGFGFLEAIDIETGRSFVKSMGFQNCKDITPFHPGEELNFGDFSLQTISFPGHSLGHVGFLFPTEKIFHISCLGFDQPKPGINGFGPWYGFKDCSIEQYLKDIDRAERIFLKRAEVLTSSHSYFVKHPDKTPFEYMRGKIQKNQIKVDQELKKINKDLTMDEKIDILLTLDLFFPKKRMKGFIRDIYSHWEYWIIRKHIERFYFKDT